jgi:hypothetical protein
MYSYCGNSTLSLTVARRDRPERAAGIGQRVDRGEGLAELGQREPRVSSATRPSPGPRLSRSAPCPSH